MQFDLNSGFYFDFLIEIFVTANALVAAQYSWFPIL